MLIQTTLQKTPHWVWPLLVALAALGLSMSFPRYRSVRSATVWPVATVVLSLYGVTSAFPGQAAALLTWALAVVGVVVLNQSFTLWQPVRWSAAEQRLLVPGSWWPLVWLLSLFATKFAVSGLLAAQPALRQDPSFAGAAGLACGLFSGAFFARGVAMWRVARRGLQHRFTAAP